MVDDFHGNAAGGRSGKGPGGVAVEAGPGLGVDLGLERGFQGLVGVAGAKEIGVAHEETFLVVVGVDEPKGRNPSGQRSQHAVHRPPS